MLTYETMEDKEQRYEDKSFCSVFNQIYGDVGVCTLRGFLKIRYIYFLVNLSHYDQKKLKKCKSEKEVDVLCSNLYEKVAEIMMSDDSEIQTWESYFKTENKHLEEIIKAFLGEEGHELIKINHRYLYNSSMMYRLHVLLKGYRSTECKKLRRKDYYGLPKRYITYGFEVFNDFVEEAKKQRGENEKGIKKYNNKSFQKRASLLGKMKMIKLDDKYMMHRYQYLLCQSQEPLIKKIKDLDELLKNNSDIIRTIDDEQGIRILLMIQNEIDICYRNIEWKSEKIRGIERKMTYVGFKEDN